MKHLGFLLLLFSLSDALYCQDTARLNRQLGMNISPRERIMLIDTVAYVYIIQTDKDSLSEVYGKKLLEIAEESKDKELLALAYLLNARRTWWDATNKQWRNERFNYYIKNLVKLARDEKLLYYEAAAIHLLGNFEIIHSNWDKGIQHQNHALLLANEIKDDSLKAEIYCSLGESYMMKGEKILAFRNIMLGLELAEAGRNIYSSSVCFKTLSDLYLFIGDTTKSIEFRKKSAELLKPTAKRNFEVYFWRNYELANLYGQTRNFPEARRIFEIIIDWCTKDPNSSIHLPIAYFGMFELYTKEKDYEDALVYYNDHPQIDALLNKWSLRFFPTYLRAKKFAATNPDSSEYYFKEVLPALEHSDSKFMKFEVISSYGDLLFLNNKLPAAIDAFNRALQFAMDMKNPESIRQTYKYLDDAYAKNGDFVQAYKYRLLFDNYTDSLHAVEKERDLAILEIQAENRRQLQKQQAELEVVRIRHNVQYIGITLAILAVFSLLITLGFFSTSNAVIKALGFFAFILLFEFIILLFDNFIHRITHGEPWKVLSIKICLIAVLFPAHHYVEQKIVNILISRKKILIDTRGFSFRKRKTVSETQTTPANSIEPEIIQTEPVSHTNA